MAIRGILKNSPKYTMDVYITGPNHNVNVRGQAAKFEQLSNQEEVKPKIKVTRFEETWITEALIKPNKRADSPQKSISFGKEEAEKEVIIKKPERKHVTIFEEEATQETQKSEKSVLKCKVFQESLGIRGHKNSCYIDSSLMSLFMYDSSFMELLNKNRSEQLPPENEKVRVILKNYICKPLQNDKIVGDKYKPMDVFRRELDLVKKGSGYRQDQKDCEEFLTTLFQEILNCPPFYWVEGEGDGHIFQTFGPAESDYTNNSKRRATVKQLLEFTLLDSNIFLEDIPDPGLIIKLPVTNGRHLYSEIRPNLTISMKKLVKNGKNTKIALSAVICLRHNHFTSFVRTNPDDIHSAWVYLDSLDHAQHRIITNLSDFLKDGGSPPDLHKHELLQLLFGHCYMCVYLPIYEK